MIVFIFVLSSVLGWVGGNKAYHYWLSKRHGKAISKAGAISAGLFIYLISFILLNAIFDTVWTAIIFMIACFVTWVGFKDSRLLRLTPSSKLLTRKQLCIYLGISSLILAVMGADTKPDSSQVAPTNTPLPVVAQNTEKTIEDNHSQDNPFNDGNASSNVDVNQVASTIQQEPSAEVNMAEEPEPVVEMDEETSIFHESDNNNCGGLPSRCTEMRDCKQAYQALECGNSRLDRDHDGIPCESICS